MYRYIKRVFDFVFSFFFIVFFLIIYVIIYIIIYYQFQENPLFLQQRVGYNGNVFKVIKFKTLRTGASQNDFSVFSTFLRKSSLDETPQFFNVLVGQMSIVGPRPLLVKYLPLYNEEQSKRHLVLPGITGAVQVNGGNSLCWQERFEIDVEYVRNRSLKTDLLILLKTVTLPFVEKDTKKHFSEPFLGNEVK